MSRLHTRDISSICASTRTGFPPARLHWVLPSGGSCLTTTDVLMMRGWKAGSFPRLMEKGRAQRITAMRVRLLGAYHDGHLDLFYPRVFRYSLQSPTCVPGLGDWLCDEFTLSPDDQVVHEIEWAGFASGQESRWIIEASDIEFQWIPT
jgi:hypothetical protein